MRTKNLTNNERQSIAVLLIRNSTHGKPHKGIVNEASRRWAVSTHCVRLIWVETKRQLAAGQQLNLGSKKSSNSGWKSKVFNAEVVSNIALQFRDTIRSLGFNSGVSKSTFARWVQKGLFRSHASAIKSDLTDKHKIHRLQFVLNAVEIPASESSPVMFKDLNHTIHIDEKWFNITKPSLRYYLLLGEALPHRNCKSKRYITKVMFMCVVARPIMGAENEVLFYGKIGIFPFTKQQLVKCSSKNRPAEVMITKQIENINKSVIRDCLINKIIPAINSRWPESASKNIIIQQNNARPHISVDDVEFMAATNSGGFNISLTCQPPNSLDLNVLDLGFCRGIQSLKQQSTSNSVEDLVEAVEVAYDKLCAEALDKVFISLQACMIEIMNRKGHNDYALPHLGKNRLAWLGLLKRLLVVEDDLIMECLDYLLNIGEDGNLSIF